MISAADAAGELLRRTDAHDNLLSFVVYTHPRWQSGAHHRIICAALERVERGEITRLIIEAPPRHSKSELTSRRFPAWFMGRNPEKMVISVSYNTDLAVDEFGRKVRNIIREPTFDNIFPGIGLADDSHAAGRWNTNKGGSYIAGGIDKGITGRGAHVLLIDDPNKGRASAESITMRKRVWDWYDADAKTRLMPGGAIVIINTRWHEDDLTGLVLRHHGDEGWLRITLPAIAAENTDDERALWPEWFPLEHLRKARASYFKSHPRDWYSLFQQEPRPSSGTYMQRAWFEQRYDEKTKPAALRIYMASDFAVSEAEEGRDPDFTEHGVFGIGPDDHVYVLDWWSGQTTPDVWIDSLIALAAKWKPNVWFGEAGMIRKAVESIIEKRMVEKKTYFMAEWIPSVEDKAVRGRAFQARCAMLTWHFPRTPWAERVIDQCVSFPGGRHDDAFDVCSLFGRVVDQAHPAILNSEQRKPQDPYDRLFKEEPSDGWKLA